MVAGGGVIFSYSWICLQYVYQAIMINKRLIKQINLNDNECSHLHCAIDASITSGYITCHEVHQEYMI